MEILDPDVVFEEFFQQVKSYIHDEPSLDKIKEAYHYAKEKHKEQTRQSGEAYVTHPVAVAKILVTFKVDSLSLISALLHDVVEDTDATLEEIEAKFGPKISHLVDGLTKIGKIEFRSSQQRMAENFRKMVIAMAKDLRVIIVKLADRLHNLRTISSLAPEKRRKIAQETLDIYAPIANRLGIYGIKGELEDLCLKEIKNGIYKEIARKIAAKKKEREAYIAEIISILETEFKKYGFKNVRVYGRPKHFFSIYRKMVDRQLAFEDIHDLFAFRIIVDSVKDCYEALGVLHAMWKPMPGRFKDYIAMPKANMYQSLHTTVVRPNGTPAEIQIRTSEMHRICECGVAAHWAYKEKSPFAIAGKDLTRYSWIRQIMELEDDLKDPDEFLAAVKLDLFEEEIFVFTPKGDVIQLAAGSTPLDFAFAVHSDIGLSTIGAKVNGRIIPLRGKLSNGDIVEIITNQNQKPSKDWLSFVITSKARNKIKSYLRAEQRNSSWKLGSEVFANEMHKKDLELSRLPQNKMDALLRTAKEGGLDDLYIAIGYGRVNAKDLLEKVFPSKKEGEFSLKTGEISHSTINPKKKNPTGVLISGLDSILVSFGRCCSPLPGESIIGFITRGKGVSIHKHDCSKALDLDPARRIEADWTSEENPHSSYTVFLKVLTHDRQGILADITHAISSCGANILKAQVRVSQNMKGILDFEITLRNLNQLQQVVTKIENVQGVLLVERKNIDYSRKTFKNPKKFS